MLIPCCLSLELKFSEDWTLICRAGKLRTILREQLEARVPRALTASAVLLQMATLTFAQETSAFPKDG